MSLNRLWQQQSKRTTAREILVPIYGGFTEGFHTADLLEAKAWREALASCDAGGHPLTSLQCSACVHNPLRVKHCHGVSSGRPHAYMLRSRLRKASSLPCPRRGMPRTLEGRDHSMTDTPRPRCAIYRCSWQRAACWSRMRRFALSTGFTR
jgi:hypothetical protein